MLTMIKTQCVCACEHTTINLTKANANQIASKVHVTEASCDDMFVRKKIDDTM